MNPQTAERLAIWLGGTHVADLLRDPRASHKPYGLQYTEQVTNTLDTGALCLSASLPVSRRLLVSKPKGGTSRTGPVDHWVAALLPEGEALAIMENNAGLARGDTFGFLRRFGHDCAGAVAFLPPGDTPDTTVLPAPEPIDLAEAINQLPYYPIAGYEHDDGLSLGGFQAKLLLTAEPAPDPDSPTWIKPRLNAPSTHICKPDPIDGTTVGLVLSEAIAMHALRVAHIDTAETQLVDVEGRPVLLVTRFDRTISRNDDSVDNTGTPAINRLHQETLCQAVGVAPTERFQRFGGPTYAQLAELLLSHGLDPDAEQRALLAQMTATVAVGNTDAHGCNYGLLLQNGSARLTPAYDVANTTAFLPRRAEGHRIAIFPDNKDRLLYVGRRSLIAEASRWGLPARDAAEVVEQTISGIVEGIAVATEHYDSWLQAADPQRRINAERSIEQMTRHADRLAATSEASSNP